MKGYVLSLCDRTGNMVRPWAQAGHLCQCIDIQHPPGDPQVEYFPSGGGIQKFHGDMNDAHLQGELMERSSWAFIAAFPPCTHLAVSGARWFKAKGMDALIDALQVVNACRKICEASGARYMIENPISTLSTYWREPDYKFDPCEYAGYLEDWAEEAYTKRTCLWTGNGFVMPEPKPVAAVLGSKMHRMAPSEDRADKRSATPRGFAKAVFLANAEKRIEVSA